MLSSIKRRTRYRYVDASVAYPGTFRGGGGVGSDPQTPLYLGTPLRRVTIE